MKQVGQKNRRVMTSSETTEVTKSVAQAEHEKAIFGDALRQAREAQGHTITEAAKATRLAEYIIEAIEKSDLDRLPPPTFVQGYLRTYARFLGVSEQTAVDNFNRAVPYKRESELHPRTSKPSQASSHSPIMRGVSMLLVFVAVLTLSYGAYDYYVKTAATIGQENASTLARERIAIHDTKDSAQDSVISEEGELIVVAPESDTLDVAAAMPPEQTPVAVEDVPAPVKPLASVEKTQGAASVDNATAKISAPTPDLLEMQAYGDSWVEIKDAADRRLYHNLLKNGQKISLQGLAPFSVFLGNAPGIELQVNKAEVKIYRFIRANSVARFSVSTEDGSAVFH